MGFVKKDLRIQKAKMKKKKLENNLLASSAQLHGEFATELIEDHSSARKIKFRSVFLRFAWMTMTAFCRFTVTRKCHTAQTLNERELVFALRADIRPLFHYLI